MAEDYYPQTRTEAPHFRDLEEKNRLLKERVVLIGENLISIREETFGEIQEIKKALITIREEQIKMKEFLQRLAEHTSDLARKEELMILQRQFDMIKHIGGN